jgi:glycosyltransferase involved in cell wall biosynthesis
VPGILIDVTRLVIRRVLGIKPAGIDRVGLEYIRNYSNRARAVLSVGPFAAPLSGSDSARMFRALLEGEAGLGFLALAIWMGLKDCAWGWIRPRVRHGILFNTAQLWGTTRHYAAQMRWLGARPVFFIHDLLPISHPEYFPSGDDSAHRAHLEVVCSIARGVVVNSEATCQALSEYAIAQGWRCPPAVVASLASGLSQSECGGPLVEERPYFVILGTIEPRKNHLLLLQIWRDLALRSPGPVPKLYVVGQRGWECEHVVDLFERCAPLKGVVVERSDCDDVEAANLLRHAQALLMPTFAEGFGLPLAEALAAGVPVIASDLPVFREIAGDIPEYVDPLDGARWRELVLDYARPDGTRRRTQLERLKSFRPTTWAQHFDIVDRFLETLP